ncbi:hypothetical protein [Actinomadura hibisca]|uniref:hypothetical protein n=1 Tax=Actinomadura hibisca TaxID=68565 RepID=UPI000829C6E6|nr:hypothetical protein [Actinomadura hibisca]
MTEKTPGDAHTLGAILATEGHDVDFCHPPGDASWPCAGLTARNRCPLLASKVDVVVDVRIDGGAFTTQEMGAICAMHHGTPLLVAGPVPPGSPLADGALFACRPDSVTAACAGMASASDGRSPADAR